MGSLKKFMLGGLDLKSNDLVRDPMRASDMRNCTKTLKGDIDKRNGYEAVETFANLQESCYHRTIDQDVFVKTDGTIWKLYNGARQNCSIASLFAGGQVIYTEYLGSLYFTTSDGKSPVVKFDGGDAYLAGLPAPTKLFNGNASTITAGTTYYFRFFYHFKDLNGNLIFGPYVEYQSNSATPTITVSTFKTGNPYGKFYNKYLVVPIQVTTVTGITPGTSNKFAYTSTNYVVGDKLLIDGEGTGVLTPTSTIGLKSKAITITAIAGGFITLDPTELSDFTFLLSTAAQVNIDSRLHLSVYRSTTASFGYENIDIQTDWVIDNSVDNFATTALSPQGGVPFEDVYNEDGQKLRPPLCKYITAYGDQLVFGNIIGVWDQLNNFTQYNNDDLVMYSDIGLADLGENHSANFQKIGESYDGAVTGIKRCNDLLVVTKNNSVFAMDGILAPGGYSLRRVPTNYIGCESHNSIIPTEGGIFFHGNDGIYFMDGVGCSKMTQLLDPLFSTIVTTSSRGCLYTKNRQYLWYMTDGVTNYILAFNYEFKEWFLWDSLDCSKGLYQKNDKSILFANKQTISASDYSKTYKFNATYADMKASDSSLLPIAAYYKANWEDLRVPALDKKFKYVRIWNLNPVSTTYSLKMQKNWIDTDLTTVTCTLAANTSIQKGHDQKNVQAIRYVFFNNTVSQNMLITGYEVQYEATQEIDKGN